VSTSSASAVKALEEALDVETELHTELAAVLTREHLLLTKMSLEELSQLEAQKVAVLERIGTQAANLKSCVKGLSDALQLPESDALSLSGITAHLHERDRTRLGKAQKELISLTSTVRDQNRINDRLIHGSLSYVTQYLTLLRNLIAGPAGYLANGVVPEHQESGRILTLKG
jgi:flagellar biosynthesis/type III secretory pathway chaperone